MPIGPNTCFRSVQTDGVKAVPLATMLQHGHEFYKFLKKNDIIFVTTGTGSGKTMCIPSYCLKFCNEHCNKNSKIILTEPKRVLVTETTLSLKLINDENDVSYKMVGSKVEDEEIDNARLLLKVNQSLINDICKSPLLENVSIVIVDESHERSQTTDLLYSLLKKISIERKKRGIMFKVVFMSATMNLKSIQRFFGSLKTEVIKFDDIISNHEVKIYNINEDYEPWITENKESLIPYNFLIQNSPSANGIVDNFGYYNNQNLVKYDINLYKNSFFKNYNVMIFFLIKKIMTDDFQGNIIVFITGKHDIITITNMIGKPNEINGILDFNIIHLTSEDYQNKKFEAEHREIGNYKRKNRIIYLSTNVAESSLTIDGLTHVIDCGIVKNIKYDPDTNSNKVCYDYITQSSAGQRAGRVGRTSPGEVYRLYSKKHFDTFMKNNPISMCTENIDLSVLYIFYLNEKYKKIDMDIGSPYTFDFIDSPDNKHITFSINKLINWKLVDNDFNITDEGKLYIENLKNDGLSFMEEKLFTFYAFLHEEDEDDFLKNALTLISRALINKDLLNLFTSFAGIKFDDKDIPNVKKLLNLGDFGCLLALSIFNPKSEKIDDLYASDIYNYRIKIIKNIKKEIKIQFPTDEKLEELTIIIKYILKNNIATKNPNYSIKNYRLHNIKKNDNRFKDKYYLNDNVKVGIKGCYDDSEGNYIVNWNIFGRTFYPSPPPKGDKKYIVINDAPLSLEAQNVFYTSCINHDICWVIPANDEDTIINRVINLFQDEKNL
jgi:hypothetical protein